MTLIQLKQIDGELTAGRLGHVHGFQLEWKSVDTVDIGPGNLVNAVNTAVIINPGTLTADLSTSGVNGLDTGVRAINTWYYLYVIAGSSGTASLWSISPGSPTLPLGYTEAFRRVGIFRNDGADELRAMGRIEGISTWRYYSISDPALNDECKLLDNGGELGFSALSLAACVPPTSRVARIVPHLKSRFRFGVILFLRETGSPSTIGETAIGVGAPGGGGRGFLNQAVGQGGGRQSGSPMDVNVNASQSVDYRMWRSGNQADIYVVGYHDQLLGV